MAKLIDDMPKLIIDFKADFPKFSPLFDDKVIEKAIGQTDKFFEPQVWGDYEKYSFYRDGWFNLVAHTLFISAIADQNVEIGNLPGSKRGIDSVKVKDTETHFGTQMFLKMEPWDDAYASSAYGVAYMQCREYVSKGAFGFFCG
jgi:hypothetical protein